MPPAADTQVHTPANFAIVYVVPNTRTQYIFEVHTGSFRGSQACVGLTFIRMFYSSCLASLAHSAYLPSAQAELNRQLNFQNSLPNPGPRPLESPCICSIAFDYKSRPYNSSIPSLSRRATGVHGHELADVLAAHAVSLTKSGSWILESGISACDQSPDL